MDSPFEMKMKLSILSRFVAYSTCHRSITRLKETPIMTNDTAEKTLEEQQRFPCRGVLFRAPSRLLQLGNTWIHGSTGTTSKASIC